MGDLSDNSNKKNFDFLANESGLAIAIVDGSGREVYAANNNSICRELNPTGKFSQACSDFCGTALAEVTETGRISSFVCHAGLECRAVSIRNPKVPLVAIVGRSFTNAQKYRRATERSISGDWQSYSPEKLFENVLLAGSSDVLDETAKQVEEIIARTNAEKEVEEVVQAEKAVPAENAVPAERPPFQTVLPPVLGKEPKAADRKAVGSSALLELFDRDVRGVTEKKPELRKEPEPPASEPQRERSDSVAKERRSAQAQAWRSFFGSLLNSDHPRACEAILGFVSAQYGLNSLIWLDRSENKLENTIAYGEMKHRRVRLGIAADDARLIDAANREMPLTLNERAGSATAVRTMNLFPIGIGGEITSAVAVLDPIDEATAKALVRMFHSLAPQLEILRLRCEVARRESIDNAVRKFSKSLRRIDADDFWLSLLQSSAEIMRAERASLLIYNEKAEKLEVKAVVGVKEWTKKNGEIGGRVARLVLEKNKAVAVDDVSKTGLPPAAPERLYKSPSFLCCPISIGGRAIGVMNFTDKVDGEAFDRTAIELFQAIGPQMAVAIDRASLKNKAGKFEQLSVTDALTGLLNRRYIEARLSEEVKRSNRHGFPMSFMMLDVDHFKTYNDQFGHPAGDEALKLVGQVIRETLRGADVAARFGGEEFAILLPQTTNEEAIAIGERIRHNIEHTRFPHRQVTTSIGVASCSAELCVSKDLVSAADRALYEAKRRGRNRVLAFEEMKGVSTA